MLKSNVFTDKKMSLVAQKEKLLQEIKYYEHRIEDFPSQNSNVYTSGYISSDSEDDSLQSMNLLPPRSELRNQEKLLSICLQATRELTSLGVLQSEVNLMEQDPVLEGEKPVSEPGTWREVTAECRIDLVPFSITFYTHQPSRKFAPNSFRGLKVLPVKNSHEAELSKSLLPSLTRPSDAVEVMRSYAIAYRSRRTTLARLADKYANRLFMEPLKEGGFVLKCANILEMAWRLENKSSSLSPFRHKMSFELEYMDESYLKIIKQAHKQLSNPSLQTDERTLLLAKIISTCLEAQTPQELYESMESDPESVKRLDKTKLDDDDEDNEPESNVNRQKELKSDTEVMAPPKSLPKKGKPKGKENTAGNRMSVKRISGHGDGNNVKKARIENEPRSEADGSKNKEKVSKHISEEKINNKLNLDEMAVRNQNVAGKVTKQNKNYAKVTYNIESVKKTGKDAEQTANEDSSKITKNKNTHDGKSTKNNEQTKKVPKIDKTSKNGQINPTSDEKTTNQAKNNEKEAKKSSNKQMVEKPIIENEIDKPKSAKNLKKKTDAVPNRKVGETDKNTDSQKVLKPPKENETNNTKSTKNVIVEKNGDVPNKKVAATDKNTITKEQANRSSKNDENVTTKIEKLKKLQQNLNEKSEPPNAMSFQNKEINEQNNPKTVKRKIDTPTEVGAKTKKINAGNQNLKSHNNLEHLNKISDNSNKNSKTKEKTTNKTHNSEAKIPEANKKKSNSASNAQKNINSVAKNYDRDSKKTTTSEAKSADNQNGNTTAKNSKTIATKKDNKTTNSHPKKDTVLAKPKSAPVIQITKHMDPEKNIKKLSTDSQKLVKSNDKIQGRNIIKTLSHRQSLNKMASKPSVKNFKKLNSDNVANLSKIPQKKLSPAYAAALKQNPLRMSPRVISKFKSSSDSNIQTNIFKQVTNIPLTGRAEGPPGLLKKPAPTSK